jgi:hypothetical protein
MSILILQDPANFIFYRLIKYLHRKYRKGQIRLLFFKNVWRSGGIGNFNITLPENIDISFDDEDFILAKEWELSGPKSAPLQMSIRCSPNCIHNMCFSEINTVS